MNTEIKTPKEMILELDSALWFSDVEKLMEAYHNQFKAEPIKSNEGNVWVKASERLSKDGLIVVFRTCKSPIPIKHLGYYDRRENTYNENNSYKRYPIEEFNIEWLDENPITQKSNDVGDETNWKAKVEFYRSETDKLRKYIFDNNIGLPNQSIFQAAIDEIEKLKQKSIDVGEQEDELCNFLSWYQSKGDEYRERTLIVDCVKDFITRKQ